MVCDFNLNSQIAGHKFAARLTGNAREHVNNLLEAEDTLYGDECSVSQSDFETYGSRYVCDYLFYTQKV